MDIKGETKVYCRMCGIKNADNAKFCMSCGSPLENNQGNEERTKVNKDGFDVNRSRNNKIIVCLVATIAMLAGILVYVENKNQSNKSGSMENQANNQNQVEKVDNTQSQNNNNNQESNQDNIENNEKQSTDNKSDLYDDTDEGPNFQVGNNGYIMPNSSSKFLTHQDIGDLSLEELALMRNEIYARNGYVFSNKKYKEYFEKKTWYTPNSSFKGNESELNKYEKNNVSLIKYLEEIAE